MRVTGSQLSALAYLCGLYYNGYFIIISLTVLAGAITCY